MHPAYSLLEALVAMAVFVIASLGLAAGIITVIRAGSVSEHVTQAVFPYQGACSSQLRIRVVM